MKQYTKIGFGYVLCGLGCFVVITAAVGVLGLYESSTGVAIATSVMSAMVMQGCRHAYFAGKRSGAAVE